MFEDKVKALLKEAFQEHEALFLIALTISPTNEVKIVIDGEAGVTVSDCIAVSRKVEHNLDREEQDFSIEVLSAGATEPLTDKRQYKKNLGRTLKVKLKNGDKLEADLIDAGPENIKLAWKAREPKPVGKGKVTVNKEAVIKYADIAQAKVKLKF